MNDFDEWCLQVDGLCRTHLLCSWADLCGDLEPLNNVYCIGETPRRFVEWWAEKYDLVWYEGGQLWM